MARPKYIIFCMYTHIEHRNTFSHVSLTSKVIRGQLRSHWGHRYSITDISQTIGHRWMFFGQLMPHVIDASILTGVGKKDRVFIPRIPIIPTKLPFQFKRLQFPVRLCFAMTINKAQGQTLRIAGLNLTSPCFSHGQLYVGCSRVGSPDNLFILAPNGKTTNIVYPEALWLIKINYVEYSQIFNYYIDSNVHINYCLLCFIPY